MPNDIQLTEEVIQHLARLPERKRAALYREIGRAEFERCAEDPMYWLDYRRHIRPYVYTHDPHPMYECLQCPSTGLVYPFNKLDHHLAAKHSMKDVPFSALRSLFRELPAYRPFPMFPYIEPLVNAWLRNNMMLIEKARDMTATWTVVALYTWDTLFHHGRQNIFQSEDASKTLDLVKRAKIIYDKQPKFLKDVYPAAFTIGPAKSGILKIESLGSEILGFPEGADQIRQYHPTGVFSDEAAFQKSAGDSFAAIKPSVQNGGRYTAVSSANPSWFQFACADTLDSLGE